MAKPGRKPKLTDWQSGPPPMIGEWNASSQRHPEAFRWWNGTCWSFVYMKDDGEEWKQQCRRAERHSTFPLIEWRGLANKPRGFVAPQPLEPLKPRRKP